MVIYGQYMEMFNQETWNDVDSSSTKGTKGTSPSENGIDDRCLKAFSGQ